MNDLHLYYFVCLDLCPIHKCVITRILRVLHIAIHCPLPAAKIRGPNILEVSPCSDKILKYKFKGHNSAKTYSTGTKFELKLKLV